MLENLINAWLTDASERSYEAAFAQLLVLEGHRVIQGPMHHAHEHGKDIIALDPERQLCVYQLKGGSGRLDTKGVEEVQDQLFAATAGIVDHPGLAEPTIPARVFLVTNQQATGPAQGRIKSISEANRQRGLPQIQLTEKSDLHSRFVAAQGRFFPSDPGDLRAFLTVFLTDGTEELPRPVFFELLESLLPVRGKTPPAAGTQRMISSAALTTAFALRPWSECENSAEVAYGWLAFCSQVLRVAERSRLSKRRWGGAYDLALEEARRHVVRLLDEALDQEDLVIPHPAEAVVYSARAVGVCGLVAASLLSAKIQYGAQSAPTAKSFELIKRELPYLKISCEGQAPHWLMIAAALSEGGDYRSSTGMLLSWINSVARANAPRSENAIPDPYHSVSDTLLNQLRPELLVFEEEVFSGKAYTVHVAIRWAARRLWRQALGSMWHHVSRVQHCEFEPGYPIEYLYREATPKGVLRTWHYPEPTSWSDLREDALEQTWVELPQALLSNPEFVPFLAIVFPHRFNTVVSDFLDSLL